MMMAPGAGGKRVSPQYVLAAVRPRYPNTPEARLRVAMRMVVELNYAATEMVVEEPDRDTDTLLQEVCLLFGLYFDRFD